MSNLELLAKTAVLTGAASFFTESRTAIEDHRIWTHRSIAFRNNTVEKGYRLAGAHLTDTKRWAGVHRIHHHTPDANLLNFVAYADHRDWHGRQTALSDGQIELPEFLYGFDPAVEMIDADTAYEIGSLARDMVGGLYRAPENYTADDAKQILYDQSPKYFYESQTEMKFDRKHPVSFNPDTPPSLHQIRFLLRDPHSPALHRMGIPGVLKYNVPLYGYVENNLADPIFRQEDLQPDEIDTWARENRGKLRYGYVGGMMLTNMLLGGKSKEKLATRAVLGAAASGAAVMVLIAGGNITNAFGHGGDLKKLTLREFLDGKVHPKSDGTYENNKKGLGPPTLDEVGGQEVHHKHPDFIAYTTETGLKKVKDAPFGSALEFLADHGIVFKRGDNFEGLDTRPDMPSEAVLKLQEYRRTELAKAS